MSSSEHQVLCPVGRGDIVLYKIRTERPTTTTDLLSALSLESGLVSTIRLVSVPLPLRLDRPPVGVLV